MAPAAPVTAPVTPGPRAAKDDVEEVSLSRMRATIARRMQQSKQNAPHYYLADEADVTDLFYIREQINEALAEKERVSVNDLILMATARALTQHPRFNGQWVEDRLQIHAHINLGVAIALDDGLVAPAILDCAHKGLRQIATEARQLAERARRGTLKAEEHSAGTFTVSNIGPFDIASIVPIINPPQVAIVGIGAAREKPVVRNGEIVVRQLMSIVLAADHRATDGAEGARFLATLRRYLEVPVLMLA
jgi:pyruvate dehydrogenase E2 component (dihydrolipoamide acetyltransferase)